MHPKIKCSPLSSPAKVAVVGAGLAGSEAAFTLAEGYGVQVHLFEMKKNNPTPAQHTPQFFAELVCSNSLKSESLLNPCGVLKQEMRALGSLILEGAEQFRVPAGEALAIDREGFANFITQSLRTHKNITVFDEIVENVSSPEFLEKYDHVIVATGPLTHDSLAKDLMAMTDSESLYFYDAIAPIVDGHTIDWNHAFRADRMSFSERGNWLKQRKETQSENQPSLENLDVLLNDEADYVNLPLSKDEYFDFVNELLNSKKVPFHNFESPKFFNGCQPIEVLAESGPRTLSFGPMKARGLVNPRTGVEPYACVQLRKENRGDESFNMVGFQTRMTWGEQKRVFQKIPALANAEFHRMGTMHRNTYLVSPKILNKDLSLKANSKLSLAGQVMGVEGYVESAAMGILVAHTVGRNLAKKTLMLPPNTTALGVLVEHVLQCEPKHFSPMNIHWGLFPEVNTSPNFEANSEPRSEPKTGIELAPSNRKRTHKPGKQERRKLLSDRALKEFEGFLETFL